MNYQKIYKDLIIKCKNINRKKLEKTNVNYVYYEKHHIIPKCLGGLNESNNLVLLTAKEHYVCHKLLTYIYKENRKIALAFHKMSFGVHNNNYKVSSMDYAYARELISLTPISIVTRKKLSKAAKGKPSKKKGIPISNEQKKKLSEAGKGRILSIETKQKISDSQKGKILSEETKQKIRLSSIGKKGTPHTQEFKKKLAENNKKYKTGTLASEETKLKMSKIRKGVKKSEEHKRKILEGRKRYFEQKHLDN
jgi:hypothetical protein